MRVCRKCGESIPDHWWPVCPSCRYHHELDIYLPSLKEAFTPLEKAKDIFEENKDISTAIKETSPAVMHELLVHASKLKLMKDGYKIIEKYEDIPSDIRRKIGGNPDICAMKNGKYLFVEVCVRGTPHIGKYSKAGNVILVLPVRTGKNITVWGLEELEER